MAFLTECLCTMHRSPPGYRCAGVRVCCLRVCRFALRDHAVSAMANAWTESRIVRAASLQLNGCDAFKASWCDPKLARPCCCGHICGCRFQLCDHQLGSGAQAFPHRTTSFWALSATSYMELQTLPRKYTPHASCSPQDGAKNTAPQHHPRASHCSTAQACSTLCSSNVARLLHQTERMMVSAALCSNGAAFVLLCVELCCMLLLRVQIARACASLCVTSLAHVLF